MPQISNRISLLTLFAAWSCLGLLHRRLLLAASLFALLSCALAEVPAGGETAPSAPPELTQLEAQFDAAYQAATAAILARYKAGLAGLQEHYTKAGSLEGALAVKAESDAIFSNICSPPMGPPKTSLQEFTQLQKEFGDAIQSAISPLRDRYKSSLAALQSRLTRTGNLEGAIAVKNTLDNLPVTGRWRTVSGEISFVITFKSDGTWSRTGYNKAGPHDYAGTWNWKDPGKHQIGLVWVPEGWKNDGDVSPDGKKIDLHINKDYRQTILRLP
jgi:hypothetical protein